MDRSEHVAWAKQRALAELDAGGPRAEVNAMASITSDLGKHPETVGHAGITMMTMQAAAGLFKRPGSLREFIQGFQ